MGKNDAGQVVLERSGPPARLLLIVTFEVRQRRGFKVVEFNISTIARLSYEAHWIQYLAL